MKTTDIEFVDYQPGGLATLCALQSAYYAQDWGFDHRYESVVSASIAEFLERYDPTKDFIQLVRQSGIIKGGIVIDSLDGKCAQLHWFILSDDLRGAGTGRKLVSNAMQFAIEKGYAEIFLTTFEGLKAAQHLYQEVGFSLTNEQRNTTWGNEVTEQRFDWTA
jgi:GNAT superfamily N-acetyltransferase|tara:strand:- start:411 stop:899 length:489 start_codon:yes stop_codon:yes gene_type:complete